MNQFDFDVGTSTKVSKVTITADSPEDVAHLAAVLSAPAMVAAFNGIFAPVEQQHLQQIVLHEQQRLLAQISRQTPQLEHRK